MGKSSVYIETSIVSYLAARTSRNLLTAACQQATADWWFDQRREFEMFTSELVVRESRAGDSELAARRLALLKDIPELTITDEVTKLAMALLGGGALPGKAQADALHIALAAVHGIDYLLTWNCRHIDNPATKPAMRAVCVAEGYVCPEICTPIEIVEVSEDER